MLTKTLGLMVCRLNISTEVKSACPARLRRLFTADRKGALGGLKVQGKDMNSASKVVYEALALQEAGAFTVNFGRSKNRQPVSPDPK